MTPEERARQLIDARLAQSGWVVQDLKKVNITAESETDYAGMEER